MEWLNILFRSDIWTAAIESVCCCRTFNNWIVNILLQIDEAFMFDLMNLIKTQLLEQNVEKSVRLNESECYSVIGPEPDVYNQSKAFVESFVNVNIQFINYLKLRYNNK